MAIQSQNSSRRSSKKSHFLHRLLTLFVTIAILCVAIPSFLWFSNNVPFVEEYEYRAPVAAEFDGYKIVNLSDFHIGTETFLYDRVIEKVKELKPDVIVMTGDYIDSEKFDEKQALKVAHQLTKIVPVYYITGNHEGAIAATKKTFFDKMGEAGVTLLLNNYVMIERGGHNIAIAGTKDDSLYFADNYEERRAAGISSAINNIPDGVFTLFLAHRPENIRIYANQLKAVQLEGDKSLILSGHAHGGQVILPFVGGVYSPGQGTFPKYYSGLYSVNGCNMIVSRGIGNSRATQRLFNQPEITLITLRSK